MSAHDKLPIPQKILRNNRLSILSLGDLFHGIFWDEIKTLQSAVITRPLPNIQLEYERKVKYVLIVPP